MTFVQVESTPYNYYIYLDKVRTVLTIPNSALGKALRQNYNLEEITLSTESAIPKIMDALSILVNDHTIPTGTTWTANEEDDLNSLASQIEIPVLSLLADPYLLGFQSQYPTIDLLDVLQLRTPSIYNTVVKYGVDNSDYRMVRYIFEVVPANLKIDQSYWMEVVVNSDNRVIDLFLERGINPSGNALRIACIQGNLHLVNKLLEDDRVDPTLNFNEPLQLAISHGYPQIVARLLQEEKVDPDAFILIAIQKGFGDITNMLSADPRSIIDHNTLKVAVTANDVSLVKRLLADPRIDPSDNDNEALKLAQVEDHLIIEDLLRNDSRVQDVLLNGHIYDVY